MSDRLFTKADEVCIQKVITWMDRCRHRLHDDLCSVHIPSARCNCGLHEALTLLRGVENGNAHLFLTSEDLEDGDG